MSHGRLIPDIRTPGNRPGGSNIRGGLPASSLLNTPSRKPSPSTSLSASLSASSESLISSLLPSSFSSSSKKGRSGSNESVQNKSALDNIKASLNGSQSANDNDEHNSSSTPITTGASLSSSQSNQKISSFKLNGYDQRSSTESKLYDDDDDDDSVYVTDDSDGLPNNHHHKGKEVEQQQDEEENVDMIEPPRPIDENDNQINLVDDDDDDDNNNNNNNNNNDTQRTHEQKQTIVSSLLSSSVMASSSSSYNNNNNNNDEQEMDFDIHHEQKQTIPSLSSSIKSSSFSSSTDNQSLSIAKEVSHDRPLIIQPNILLYYHDSSRNSTKTEIECWPQSIREWMNDEHSESIKNALSTNPHTPSMSGLSSIGNATIICRRSTFLSQVEHFESVAGSDYTYVVEDQNITNVLESLKERLYWILEIKKWNPKLSTVRMIIDIDLYAMIEWSCSSTTAFENLCIELGVVGSLIDQLRTMHTKCDIGIVIHCNAFPTVTSFRSIPVACDRLKKANPLLDSGEKQHRSDIYEQTVSTAYAMVYFVATTLKGKVVSSPEPRSDKSIVDDMKEALKRLNTTRAVIPDYVPLDEIKIFGEPSPTTLLRRIENIIMKTHLLESSRLIDDRVAAYIHYTHHNALFQAAQLKFYFIEHQRRADSTPSGSFLVIFLLVIYLAAREYGYIGNKTYNAILISVLKELKKDSLATYLSYDLLLSLLDGCKNQLNAPPDFKQISKIIENHTMICPGSIVGVPVHLEQSTIVISPTIIPVFQLFFNALSKRDDTQRYKLNDVKSVKRIWDNVIASDQSPKWLLKPDTKENKEEEKKEKKSNDIITRSPAQKRSLTQQKATVQPKREQKPLSPELMKQVDELFRQRKKSASARGHYYRCIMDPKQMKDSEEFSAEKFKDVEYRSVSVLEQTELPDEIQKDKGFNKWLVKNKSSVRSKNYRKHIQTYLETLEGNAKCRHFETLLKKIDDDHCRSNIQNLVQYANEGRLYYRDKQNVPAKRLNLNDLKTKLMAVRKSSAPQKSLSSDSAFLDNDDSNDDEDDDSDDDYENNKSNTKENEKTPIQKRKISLEKEEEDEEEEEDDKNKEEEEEVSKKDKNTSSANRLNTLLHYRNVDNNNDMERNSDNEKDEDKDRTKKHQHRRLDKKRNRSDSRDRRHHRSSRRDSKHHHHRRHHSRHDRHHRRNKNRSRSRSISSSRSSSRSIGSSRSPSSSRSRSRSRSPIQHRDRTRSRDRSISQSYSPSPSRSNSPTQNTGYREKQYGTIQKTKK